MALNSQSCASVMKVLPDNRLVAKMYQSGCSMDAGPRAQTCERSSRRVPGTLALELEPGATSRERAQAWLPRSAIAEPIWVVR